MVKEYWRDFLSLLFPDNCISCNQLLVNGEEHICLVCKEQLPKTDYHKETNPILRRKFDGIISVEYTLAYLRYTRQSVTQRLLSALKYKNQPEIGTLLGKWYGAELRKEYQVFDLIVPVPLHEKRQTLRGYNQSEFIALGLAKSLKTPVDTQSLLRINETVTQTQKSREHRRESMKDVFKVRANHQLSNRHVLLVDDVITTGATLEVCIQVLLEAGVGKVSICALADAY